MNKKYVGVFLYIFMFTTLLLSINSNVFAANTPEELLQEIANSAEIAKHKIDNSGAITTDYVLAIPVSILENNFNNSGTISVDDKDYHLNVAYQNSEGRTFALASTNWISNECEEEHGVYVVKLAYDTNETFDAGGKIKYTLEPINGGETIILDEQSVNWNGREIETEGFQSSNIWETITDFLFNTKEKLAMLITEFFCKLLLSAGDSFLHMISLAVGEPVTIDKAVYNQVGKLSIDFYEKPEPTAAEIAGITTVRPLNTPLKEVMRGVVTNLYDVFKNITLVVYMVMLVYLGLKILLNSTAEKKADYKTVLTAWVMGIVMLMFFPYVMKYTIKANDALCEWLYSSQSEEGKLAETPSALPSIRVGRRWHGTDGFVMVMMGHDMNDINEETMKEFISNPNFGNNVMMEIRLLAAHKYDIPLIIVYFILIGQLLAILVLYYKRVFMIAFLIVIFPLVMMLYPLSKIGDIKLNSFGIWFKEFLVNVFIQIFHAVTYMVIVTIGVNSYLQSGNWLFMILCILFLFEGEKVIRAIFNVKSSMNSIGDMAAAGAMAMSIAKNAGKFIPSVDLAKKGGSGKKEAEEIEEKAEKDRDALKPKAGVTPVPNAQSNIVAANGANPNTQNLGNLNVQSVANTTVNTTTNNSVIPIQMYGSGNQNPREETDPIRQVDNNLAAKNGKGLGQKTAGFLAKTAGSIASGAGQAIGATVGATFGIAQKGDLGDAVSGAVSGMSTGKQIGTGISKTITGVVDKAGAIYTGFAVAGEYKKGEHDDELGISEADAIVNQEKTEAIRKAYAKLARRRNISSNGAEILFIRENLKRLKEEEDE